jgi:hypothetical protein
MPSWYGEACVAGLDVRHLELSATRPGGSALEVKDIIKSKAGMQSSP